MIRDLTTYIGILIAICVVCIAILLSSGFYKIGYSEGFCAALGGEVIGFSDTCDVDGKVVKVE